VKTTTRTDKTSRLAAHLLLAVGALVMIMPFLWMLSTSVKSFADSMSVPPKWLPTEWRFDNYARVIDSIDFGTYYLNTVIVTLGRTAGQLVLCSLAAYAFASLRFPFKNTIFLALLAVLMLRGPQTPGELNQRASRLHAFGSLAAVQETLDRLVARELVARLERRPGQKEERFAQILGGGDAESAPPAAPAVTAPTPTEGDAVPPAPQPGPEPAAWADSAPAPAVDEARIERLEREVAALRAELDALRDELGA